MPVSLTSQLAALRDRYDTPQALAMDPLTIPLRFAVPLDREVAAFAAAHLAYGRVAPMLRAIDAALAPLGARPAEWLRALTPAAAARELAAALSDWKWRFHTGGDMAHWLAAWARLDRESGAGLEPHLLPTGEETADDALSRLVRRLRSELPATRGLRFNLPDPREGSACKRWRMFLRWMVRRGWPDLGLWTRYPADQLVIPLDTHVARVSRYIGLTKRATPDGVMAREITSALRRRAPDDPLAYDFALSHLGILGDCPGLRALPGCRPCPLVAVCRAGKK